MKARTKHSIIHITLGKSGTQTSGGEVFMIGIIKEIAKNRDVFQTVITTKNALKLYEDNFRHTENVAYVSISNIDYKSNIGIFISYIVRVISALRYLLQSKLIPNLVITHSEYWCDTIPAYLLANTYKKLLWYSFFHSFAPNPFKGYRYFYISNRYKIPNITETHNYLNRLIFRLLAPRSKRIFTVNSLYIDYLRKVNTAVSLIRLKSDLVNYPELEGTAINSVKKYDACFVGRFSHVKGIEEIIDIVKKIKEKGWVDFKMVMIGEDNNRYARHIKSMINSQGLKENFLFTGQLSGSVKFQFIRDSKVMFLTSYYESFAIVYLDAIGMGIPVIEYDMDFYSQHVGGSIKVPFLDNNKFVQEYLTLVRNPKVYNAKCLEAVKYYKTVKNINNGELILNYFKEDYEKHI